MEEPVVKLHDSEKSMILNASCKDRQAGPINADGGLLERVGEEALMQDTSKGRFCASKSFATGSEFKTGPNLVLSEEEVERFYAYGFAQYGSGQWGEAADVFRLLCTRRPLEPRFWFALGATLQEAGSYNDALHSWAMAALLKKEDPYPHFHAAECCFSLHMSQDAAKALAESEVRIQSEPTHPLKGKIGLLKQQWRL